MKTKNTKYIRYFSICISALILSGCASTPKRTAVPQQSVQMASIPGVPDARRMGDEPSDVVGYILSLTPEEAQQKYPNIVGKKHTFLVLSGGGSNGAFGAGLLNGWTANGNRPEFNIVTGISTGSILAPWAFLGSDYDYVAKELFSKYDTKQVVKERGLFSGFYGLFGDALTDSTPLRSIIYGYLGPDEIEKIAAAHRKGRRLFIGTTNLDMLRPITWDLGAIACSDHPDKRDLMVDVILASASIPIAFPPVFMDVEANGNTYQELHVDGGLARQLFFYPEEIHWDQIEKILKSTGTSELYVIRNAKVDPQWKEVEANLVDMGGRSLSSLIRTQGIGDISRIYLAAKRDGLDFHLSYIPETFNHASEEAFDREHMQALYQFAYDSITKGDPWIKQLD